MRRIDTYIEKMKKVYDVYISQPSFKNQDFKPYIDMVKKDIDAFDAECTTIEQRFKQYKYK